MSIRNHPSITLQNVASATCWQFTDVDIETLRSKKRTAHVAYVRFVAFVAARKLGFLLTEIGAFFNRDHVAVIYGIKQINTCPDLSKYLASVEEIVKSLAEPKIELVHISKTLPFLFCKRCGDTNDVRNCSPTQTALITKAFEKRHANCR